MMSGTECKIVFCDVDGTLLASNLEVLPGTLKAIGSLKKRGVPFVITSARSPAGIRPIFARYGFCCPIVAYSGALIVDEEGAVLFSAGIAQKEAEAVIRFVEQRQFDCTWNIYSGDTWLVKDKTDPRVIREENIVRAQATQGSVASLAGADVNKILLMCAPDVILQIEQQLKSSFPALSIVKSSDILLEVMKGGVTKAQAVLHLCQLFNVSADEAAAFGDNYNDEQMLGAVGLPFVMANAPGDLKSRFDNVAPDNDSEGIYLSLKSLGLVD